MEQQKRVMAKNLDNLWPGPRTRKPTKAEGKGDRAPALPVGTVIDRLIVRTGASSADVGRTLFAARGSLLNALLDGDPARTNAELRRIADSGQSVPTRYVGRELLQRAWALNRAVFELGRRAVFVEDPRSAPVAMLSADGGAKVAKAVSSVVAAEPEPSWDMLESAVGWSAHGAWDGSEAHTNAHDTLRLLAVLIYSMAYDVAYSLDDPAWKPDNLWPILFPGAPALSRIDES
jgi:hypothetical protein